LSDELDKKLDAQGEISVEDVQYVLKFAESLAGYNGYYGNALTPMLLNQRMKDMNLNPMQATEDLINKALQNPKDSEIQLQEFSQDFEIQSQIYKKLLSYLGTMLAFDLTYESDAKSTDYKTSRYQKDLDIVKKFIDSFDYRREFGVIVQELLRNEAFFGCPRFDNDKLTIQELPASPTYTMITGRWPYGLLASFNFVYFLQPGTDLALFPPFFKEKFGEFWIKNKGQQSYLPALAPDLRGNSSWVWWQDLPPSIGWVWKMNPSMASRQPYYSGLFPDILLQNQMRSLQKNINMASAAKIIIGEIPLLNKATQAGVKDSFAISSQNLGQFLALVKSAIGDSLRTAAVPLSNVQGISFQGDNDLYSSYLRTALSTSGVNTNLLFTGDVKPNAIESQLSLNVDENQMYALYPQFANFIEYWVNKQTKNFKFRFHFEGSNFFNNRQQRFDKAMSLANMGIFLPQKIAASMGMNKFEFDRQLEESKADNYTDKFTIPTPAFQGGGQTEGAGRPKKSDSELGDAGEETKSNASNIGRGGKL
jgi:hypothetical protein